MHNETPLNKETTKNSVWHK